MHEKLDDLRARREAAQHAGSERAVERQHAKGKMLARERIDYFLDEGSFHELDLLARHRAHEAGLEERPYTDGVITGWGTVEGRKVFVFSQDFTVFGGALGEVFAEKIHKLMDLALKTGAPVVGLNDGAGARIQEGVVSLASYGGIFRRNVQSSGVVPQISVILGPCAGGAVYSPAMTDFIFMVRESSHMFITGPDVVKTVTGEEVTLEELGGAMSHATKSASPLSFPRTRRRASTTCASCSPSCRRTTSSSRRSTTSATIPIGCARSSTTSSPPVPTCRTTCTTWCVRWSTRASSSSTSRTGRSRSSAGSPASTVTGRHRRQPAAGAGGRARHRVGEKAARFVRTCDAFNIPLVTFVDVPGFLPGVDQEYGGIIRHGAKLLYAFCEASVPRIQVITRKAYGGAYVVMNSKSIGADLAFAWPSAELAVMGPQGAVEVVYRRELQQAADPESRRAELVEEYTEKYANPYAAAERGYVDDVIEPAETRRKVVAGLRVLQSKREDLPQRKHGNVPL